MSARTPPGNAPARAPSRVAGWFDHHVFSFVASLGRMAAKPWAAGLTVGVMAVALALPLGLWATMANMERFVGDVQEARQIDLFLQPDVDAARAETLAAELRARGDVAAVELRTPDEGLQALRGASGLDEALEVIGANPLPFLLVVAPAGDEMALAEALRALPEADVVQHDAAWRERLDGWLRLGTRLAWVLAVLLGVGALLVVGNTVRLDIQQRREEISVLQQLGATDGFIRRPFLYLGTCYGVLAGSIALVVLTVVAWSLRPPLAALARSYGSDFMLQGFGPTQALVVVAGAGLLGWLGAGLVAGQTLRQTRSTET